MTEAIELANEHYYTEYADANLLFKFENGDKLYRVLRRYTVTKSTKEVEDQTHGGLSLLISGNKKGFVESAICINGKTQEVHSTFSGYKAGKFKFDSPPPIGNYVTEEKFGNCVSGGGQVSHKAHEPIEPGEYVAFRDTSWIGRFTGRQYSAEYLIAA